MDHHLQGALEAARAAGEVLREHWGKLSDIREKGIPGDLVTEADKHSEKTIIEILERRYPSYGIMAEESGAHHGEADFLWVVDPLDGTTNYAHSYPMVSVSIALLHQGEPILGVVYNPIVGELFHALKGQGAYCNGKKLNVSSIADLEHSLLVTGFPYDRRTSPVDNYAEFCHLTNIAQGVRRVGSAAIDLAYVAAGRLEGHWEPGLKAWDVAAGTVLVWEAGGLVTGYNMEPLDLYNGRIIATNGLVHEKLSEELRRAQG
ncbi:MAG: inositol monophosphatase family protein [Chlamydiota bacterium]